MFSVSDPDHKLLVRVCVCAYDSALLETKKQISQRNTRISTSFLSASVVHVPLLCAAIGCKKNIN